MKCSKARRCFFPKSDFPNRRVLLLEGFVPGAFEKLDDGFLNHLGKEGRVFWLYKFRSMRAGDSEINVTAEGDSRITTVGRFLRRVKMDELPQLINVIKGEMSLVGPRPEVPEYVERYSAEQREILSVRPGITGLAQLEFRDEERLLAGRSDVKSFYLAEVMPQKLEIDRRYVRERSLLLDVVILFRTAGAVLKR